MSLWVLAAITLLYPLSAWQLDRYGRRRIDGEFDAIVVAGCKVMPSGRPSQALARRVRLAVALYRQGVAERIVMTGGVGDHAPSEAHASATLAQELGVPPQALILEEQSTSTEENAKNAAELIGSQATVVVVTDAYHVYRAERVFGRFFSQVHGVGCVASRWARIKGSFREVTALVAYALTGKLR